VPAVALPAAPPTHPIQLSPHFAAYRRGGAWWPSRWPATTSTWARGPTGLVDLRRIAVYVGLKVRERAEQVEVLVRRHVLREDLTGARIVIGDLNEWFPGAVGRALGRAPRT